MAASKVAFIFLLLVALQPFFFLQPVYGVADKPDYISALLIVVSQGKDGDFNTVQDAVNAVPNNNKELIFIRVMPGIYREKVIIPAEKPYIILSGFNASNTVITWNDHASAAGGTYSSATVTVFASDFVARFITIENSYGPGDKAVAIRISGDRSAFYGCRFLGFQDTVLDSDGRHYFKTCFIEGAIDFICGNGQSIYENCHLHTIPQRNGAIAAQKRNASGDGTGFVFSNCRVTGGGLMYLGRAWGRYSRIIFASTYMDDIIFPEGWDDWKDPSRQKFVTFGQYKCNGAGSNTERRVPWSYELSDDEAAPFLTSSFVDGEQWIQKMPTRLKRATNLIPKNG